ncbi:MAG TPA: hypothetical protein VEY30_03745, partial [Myxococcaceae bacterium]|nr:hypothetical protein [Myxococcaceae bacterium]
PDAFLSEDAVPPEMVAALRRCLPRPTPPISPCTMPTQPLTPAVWIQRIQQLLPAPEDAQGSWNSQA